MYRKPSRKYKNKQVEKPNLIPILDSVFIFIFFLLMSANFVKIYEIQSDVPIISNKKPPKKQKKQLNLTLKIHSNSLTLHAGNRERQIFKVGKNEEGDYDTYKLREKLISLKKRHKDEETIVFMPKANISYEDLIKVMDAVRDLKDTDPEIWTKSKEGDDIKITKLFNNIIFGDTQS
jgi:biopolymer transport protein ExbD